MIAEEPPEGILLRPAVAGLTPILTQEQVEEVIAQQLHTTPTPEDFLFRYVQIE